jgi:uncharacterized protein with von Willebrand factor type A (vWA) domain
LPLNNGAGLKIFEKGKIMNSSSKVWDNEAALAKFAEQFHLTTEDVKTVKELEQRQEGELKNKGKRWFFRPLKFLS